jgi:nicotinamidase-related amidase
MPRADSMTATALLIMDVQQGVVERYAHDDYLARLATAIAAARRAGVTVIYVTVAFRPGYPEVSERNKSFAAIAGTGRFTQTEVTTIAGWADRLHHATPSTGDH